MTTRHRTPQDALDDRARSLNIRPSDEMIGQMVTAYQDGASLTEVARAVGVAPRTARKYVACAGVPLRPSRSMAARDDPSAMPVNVLDIIAGSIVGERSTRESRKAAYRRLITQRKQGQCND